MKVNRLPKKAGNSPDFWPRKSHSVTPEDLKDWVYDQYLNQQIMSIYCDAAVAHNQKVISVACSFVANGSVLVKEEYIQPPSTFEVIPPIYAEMKSVIFALKNYENYIDQCDKAIIYSDVNHIAEILVNNNKLFKRNPYLQAVRDELKELFNKKSSTSNVNFAIEYLPKRRKKFNPFYKSAHNAANRMVRNFISR